MLISSAVTGEAATLREPSGRIPFLDGWRAVAVSVVILDHAWNALVAELSFPLARVGVHIFFAISAFIITHLSLREIAATGEFNVRNFFIRRALRILPPMALYLVAVLLVSGETFDQQAPQVVRAALFTCNMKFEPWCTWQVGHTWTLAFEEQFYLLFPFLLLKRFRLILLPVLACYLLPLIMPLGYVGRAGFLQISMLFALGMMYAHNKQRWDAWFIALPWPVYALAPLVAIGWMLMPDTLVRDASFFVEPPAIFLCVFGAAVKFPALARALSWKPLTTLGLWSYSIYLWQQLFTAPEGATPEKVVVGLAVTVLVSWASYRWYEAPFRTLSRRFAPGTAPALSSGPGAG